MKRYHIQTQEGLIDRADKIKELTLGEFGIILEIKTGIRTTRQNSAMHQYFTMLANELNDAGLDMKKVLKPEIEIPWGKDSVKEHLWKPIMEAVTEKTSTRDLERPEVSAVYDVLHRHIAGKFGVMVAFPDRFSR